MKLHRLPSGQQAFYDLPDCPDGSLKFLSRYIVDFRDTPFNFEFQNEGSPGQALKRLLGLRTFGSPAAQTLASHTSFAGM